MRVIIVGAGVTGLFTAYYMLKHGHSVTLIDRKDGNCVSLWNAGLITPSTALAPTMGMSTILSQILGARGPIRISPIEIITNLRWFSIALRKGLTGQEERILQLGQRSLQMYSELFDEESIEVDLREGLVDLFMSQAEAKATAMITNGRFLDQEEASEIGFTDVGGGVFLDREFSLNPVKLLYELSQTIARRGARLEVGQQVQVNSEGDSIVSVSVNQQRIVGDKYILTAGPWSRQICKTLGYDPPILPARGLVILFATNGEEIVRNPVFFEDYGMGIAQHDPNTLRVTGFFELVGFEDSYSTSRKAWLLDTLKKHLRKCVTLRYLSEGVGYRPCTPDQLPIIGAVPKFTNLFMASGNCRLGMTLAPATAEILCHLLEGGTMLDRWDDFSPLRFSNAI